MKSEIRAAHNSLTELDRKAHDDMFKAQIQLQRLRQDLNARDELAMKLSTDLDWARNRIESLENALHQATREIKTRTESSEKWELKAGNQQQQINELEK